MNVLIFMIFHLQTLPNPSPGVALPVYMVPPTVISAEFSSKLACENAAAAIKIELQKAVEPNLAKVAWICRSKS